MGRLILLEELLRVSAAQLGLKATSRNDFHFVLRTDYRIDGALLFTFLAIGLTAFAG
jgi:hypothetical protein